VRRLVEKVRGGAASSREPTRARFQALPNAKGKRRELSVSTVAIQATLPPSSSGCLMMFREGEGIIMGMAVERPNVQVFPLGPPRSL